LGGGQFPYDRDLLGGRLDLRRGCEPVARQPAAEPAAYLFRSASLTRRGLVCAHIVTRSRVLAASVRIAIRPGRVRGPRIVLRCTHVIMITRCYEPGHLRRYAASRNPVHATPGPHASQALVSHVR